MERMLDTVTILRGIAALIIITIHAPLPASQINAPIGIAIATIGFIGIYAFFFLSGFILGKRYLENQYTLSGQGILSFYWKRFKKIAPLYYLIILYIFFQTPSFASNFGEVFRLLTFTASEKIQLPFASYLWFISTIMQMYLIAPLGFLGLDHLKKKTLLFRLLLSFFVLILGALIRAVLIPHFHYEFITQSVLLNIYIFLFGMSLSLWNRKIFIPHLLRLGIIIFIMVVFYFSFAEAVMTNISNARLTHQTVIIPSVSFILFALMLSVFPAKIPVKSYSPIFLFQLIGIFSYEIYLLHQPIYNKLNLSCAENCTPLIFITNVVVVTVISLLIAAGIRLVIKSVKL